MSRPDAPVRRRRIWFGAAGLVAVVCGLLAYATRPDPAAQLQQALQRAVDDPAECERLLVRAIASRGGKHPDAQLLLAWLRGHRGDWSAAAAQLAAVDPAACRPNLLVMFGREALRSGNSDLAISALEPLRERDVPERAAALELLWNAYYAQGDPDPAVAVAHELLRREPRNFTLRLQLIRALKSAHQETECLAEVRAALESDPPADIRRELQYLELEQHIVLGEVDAARRQADLLRQTDADSPRLAAQIIDLYRLEGKLDQALAAITALFPRVQQLPAAWLTRGAVYLDLGRFQEAAHDLQRLVEMEPFNEGGQFKLSEAYRGLGQIELARRHREAGAEIRRKRIRINTLLKELRSAPASPAACMELARLYDELGEVESAGLWRRRAAQTEPRTTGTAPKP